MSIEIARSREVFITIPRKKLLQVLKPLGEKGARLSCITGIDTGKAIDVLYHLLKGGRSINIRVPLPRDKPEIETVIRLYPGANLFERELHEMLGVKVLGHPDPRRLFLPEDWKGRPPYRKA